MCLYMLHGYTFMTKTLTLSDKTFAKISWLKNRYEALEDGKSLTWDTFFNKLTEDSVMVLSYKFHRKTPDVTVDDIMTFLLGSFMSIDEVLRDEGNNEIYGLLAKKENRRI